MNEEAKTPFWKPALIYGAILGVVGIVLGLIFYFMNLYTAGWVSYLTIAVTIAVMAYCLVSYRNDYLGGYATFGQLFLIGLVIGVISSILGAAYTYLLHTVIDPDLADKMKVVAQEKIMNNSRIPESMYEDIFDRMEKRMVPGRMAVMALIVGPIVNALFALIISAFVKKEENPAGNAV